LGAWKLVRDVGLIPISLTGMFWFLRRRIDILAEADEFMGSFGEHAYQEARYELAKAFERGGNARMKFLERVCKEIEKRTDFQPEARNRNMIFDIASHYPIDWRVP
jgi:hypothetical protein